MTAEERKKRNEALLSSLNIPTFGYLPPIKEEEAIDLKPAVAVAKRILILTCLNCIGMEQSLAPAVVEFLKEKDLWGHVSATERLLFEKEQLNGDDESLIAWRCESIWLMLWAINKVETLHLPQDTTDVGEIIPLLPPFLEDPSEFINSASMRPKAEILDQADFLFRLNWAFLEADKNGTSAPNVSRGVAMERYHALQWMVNIQPEWDADFNNN